MPTSGLTGLPVYLCRSYTSLPSEDYAADLERPASIALECLAGSFQDRLVPLELDDASTPDQPQQPLVIEASKGPLTITPEQIQRSPPKCFGKGSPFPIKEPAAIVDELHPAFWRHIGRGA